MIGDYPKYQSISPSRPGHSLACPQMVSEADSHQRKRGWTRPRSSDADLYRLSPASSRQHTPALSHHHISGLFCPRRVSEADSHQRKRG